MPILESVLEFYYRKFHYGSAEAWFGLKYVTAITRPFTYSEDKVFEWITEQDGCALVEVYPLNDGRDYIVLERCYTKQSEFDAKAEQAFFLGLNAT